MIGNIRILTYAFIFHLLSASDEIKPEIVEFQSEIFESSNVASRSRQISSTMYKTVNKYYCTVGSILNGSHLMVYGSKGWTFPVQDVNLTLQYPTVDQEQETLLEEYGQYDYDISYEDEFDAEEYIITGFEVILKIDGPGSKGYIMNGGVLRDRITLSFVISQISTLQYEFWLYGAMKANVDMGLPGNYRVCY